MDSDLGYRRISQYTRHDSKTKALLSCHCWHKRVMRCRGCQHLGSYLLLICDLWHSSHLCCLLLIGSIISRRMLCLSQTYAFSSTKLSIDTSWQAPTLIDGHHCGAPHTTAAIILVRLQVWLVSVQMKTIFTTQWKEYFSSHFDWFALLVEGWNANFVESMIRHKAVCLSLGAIA